VIVNCLSIISDPDRAAKSGADVPRPVRYALSIGRDYCVLGLGYLENSPIWGVEVLFEIVDDQGHLVSVPAGLFKVQDGRLPDGLIVKETEGNILIWPPEFFDDFFHDRLSDGDSDARAALAAVVERVCK